MPRRAVAGLAALHAALGLWALAAWVHGPFRGEGVLDGAEVLAQARTGSAGAFQTKSPLYPALLRAAFAIAGDSPWTVGALGLALSVATLLATARLAVELGHPRAAPWAAALYALSGSALVFAIQPLPVMLATALLAWSVVAALRASARGGALAAALAGLALGAATFTRAPLLIPAAGVVVWLAARRRLPAAATVAAGMLAVALTCFAACGSSAWPTGSMLNLRLGNGAARSGISDLRPGPSYDRVRIEAASAAPAERGAAPAFERFQRNALRAEVEADPPGAIATLARKAYLFWFRTETVTAADFRHGLRGFPLAPLLLASFGLVVPLALASLVRARPAAVWLPLLGVLAVNVVWLTSARYRFPALPLLCVAAATLLAAPPRPREWLLAAALAVPLNLSLAGTALLVPGDGLVQEGRLWMERDRLAPRARQAYEEAIASGSRDPRARYELALALEARGQADAAEARYREALELDPLYPEAAENLLALLLREGRAQEAREEGERLVRTSPHAGKAWLNLAAARRALEPGADVRTLEAEGFLRLSLRALAQADLATARRFAAEARARGLDDPRLP
jgi:tetratricopeptide (TPR) repeat protein